MVSLTSSPNEGSFWGFLSLNLSLTPTAAAHAQTKQAEHQQDQFGGLRHRHDDGAVRVEAGNVPHAADTTEVRQVVRVIDEAARQSSKGAGRDDAGPVDDLPGIADIERAGGEAVDGGNHEAGTGQIDVRRAGLGKDQAVRLGECGTSLIEQQVETKVARHDQIAAGGQVDG